MPQRGTLTEVSVSSPLDAVAGDVLCPYGPQMANQNSHVCSPHQQTELLPFLTVSPIHHSQPWHGQPPHRPGSMLGCHPPKIQVSVHTICPCPLSVSLWPECLLSKAPGFLICQPHSHPSRTCPWVPTPPHNLVSLSFLCFRGTCLDAGSLRGKREKEEDLGPSRQVREPESIGRHSAGRQRQVDF